MSGKGGEGDGVFFAVIGILYVLCFAGVIGWSLGRRELRREQRIDRLQASVWKLEHGAEPSLEELADRQRVQFRDDVAAGVAAGLNAHHDQRLVATA